MHRWFLFATLLMRAQPASTRLLITLLYGLHPLALAGLLAGCKPPPTDGAAARAPAGSWLQLARVWLGV